MLCAVKVGYSLCLLTAQQNLPWLTSLSLSWIRTDSPKLRHRTWVIAESLILGHTVLTAVDFAGLDLAGRVAGL